MPENKNKEIIKNNASQANILHFIKQQLPGLSSSQKKVAKYILTYPEKVLSYTALQISKEIEVSEATVIRFCRGVGYKGFPELKIKLAKDFYALQKTPEILNVNKGDELKTIIEKIVIGNIEDFKYLHSMLDLDVIAKAVEYLQNAERIVFFGVGGTYPVAYDAYWHFSNIGKIAITNMDPGAQLILAQSLGKNDVAVAISISGKSRVPIMCAEIAKGNSVPIISITQNINSALAEISDCSIVAYRRDEQSHDLITRSKILLYMIINILCMATTISNWDESIKNISKNLKLTSYQQI